MTPEQQKAHDEAKLAETGFYGSGGAGCVFVARSTGRVLLAFRSGKVEQPYTWGTWGGAVAEGEDFYEAAVREVKEEAGYEGDFEMIPAYVFTSGDFTYQNFIAAVEDEFVPEMDWETCGYAWIPAEDLGELPYIGTHFGLNHLLEHRPSRMIINAIVSNGRE